MAAKIMRIAKEATETNIPDALTKLLKAERKGSLLRFLKNE
jgi:hypothetical protein